MWSANVPQKKAIPLDLNVLHRLFPQASWSLPIKILEVVQMWCSIQKNEKPEEIWIAQEVHASPHAHSRSIPFPNKEAYGKFFIWIWSLVLGWILFPMQLKMLQLISLNLVYLPRVDLLVYSSPYSCHNLTNPRAFTQNSTLV